MLGTKLQDEDCVIGLPGCDRAFKALKHALKIALFKRDPGEVVGDRGVRADAGLEGVEDLLGTGPVAGGKRERGGTKLPAGRVEMFGIGLIDQARRGCPVVGCERAVEGVGMERRVVGVLLQKADEAFEALLSSVHVRANLVERADQCAQQEAPAIDKDEHQNLDGQRHRDRRHHHHTE